MKLKCTALGSYVMTANLHSVVTTILKYWNSRSFKDLLHQIPKLSMPYSIFKHFPCPGKMERKNQGLSRTFTLLSSHDFSTVKIVLLIIIIIFKFLGPQLERVQSSRYKYWPWNHTDLVVYVAARAGEGEIPFCR